MIMRSLFLEFEKDLLACCFEILIKKLSWSSWQERKKKIGEKVKKERFTIKSKYRILYSKTFLERQHTLQKESESVLAGGLGILVCNLNLC